MHFIWRPNLSELPERPGVYLFRSAKGVVLYVGKALNLRRRIASYFYRRRPQPPRMRRMIARARAVSIHETGSELEALLLESRLIKREKPPFNRLSTVYTPLPFVKLTLNEPFPRLLVTRAWLPDGGQYLGPFRRFEIAVTVWAALQRLFPLRGCEAPVRPGVSPLPCAAYHVKTCAAPCVGQQAAVAYQRHVDALVRLLSQGYEAITERLRQARQRAADGMFFERAGHLHTLLGLLDEAMVGKPLALLPVELRNIVVIFTGTPPQRHEIIGVRHGLFAGRCLIEGRPKTARTLEAFLSRCFGAVEEIPRPGEAVVDELHLVTGWLHRTRAQARWVYLESQMNAKTRLEAVLHALPDASTSTS